MKIPHILFLSTSSILAGPYPGAPGTAGSDAISKDDPAIVAWASGHAEIQYGTEVESQWLTPAKATGPAVGDSFDVVSLGNGGRITMYFPNPILDGPGPDFAVFENGVGNTFLELAFVEVSSNGADWFRFPNDSRTSDPVGGFGSVDPTNLFGLASKYGQGFGTPFDLSALPDDPRLDKTRVRFVRLLDIIGDGRVLDSDGDPIYDPHPAIGSGGFDLDAIAVLHQNPDSLMMTGFSLGSGQAALEWLSNPGQHYAIETSPDLEDWSVIATVQAAQFAAVTSYLAEKPVASRSFWRVVEFMP
jgi:hypothetical protein